VSAVLLLHTLARLGLDIGLIRFLPDETDKPGMITPSLTIVGLFSAVWPWCLWSVWVFGRRNWPSIRDMGWYAVLSCAFAVVTSLVEILRPKESFVDIGERKSFASCGGRWVG